LPSAGLPAAQLLSAFVLIGAGLGIASVASTQTGTDAAEPALRGVASGVLNSAAQVGTAVGVALLVPLATATGSTVMAGYRIGFLGAIAVALAGALSSFLIPVRLQQSDPAVATTADYPAKVGGSKRRKQTSS
jgi:MFS family permease